MCIFWTKMDQDQRSQNLVLILSWSCRVNLGRGLDLDQKVTVLIFHQGQVKASLSRSPNFSQKSILLRYFLRIYRDSLTFIGRKFHLASVNQQGKYALKPGNLQIQITFCILNMEQIFENLQSYVSIVALPSARNKNNSY